VVYSASNPGKRALITPAATLYDETIGLAQRFSDHITDKKQSIQLLEKAFAFRSNSY